MPSKCTNQELGNELRNEGGPIVKKQKVKVRDVMTSLVYTCETGDSLDRAAQLLWEHDCGCLPVVDSEGLVRSMITDRDICMAAYTGGRFLSELRVEDSMSTHLVACGPDDDLAVAALKMAENQVRRLPVVDEAGQVRGLLSVNDMACCGAQNRADSRSHDRVSIQALKMVLVSVCRHRPDPCNDEGLGIVELPAASSTAGQPVKAPDESQKAKSSAS